MVEYFPVCRSAFQAEVAALANVFPNESATFGGLLLAFKLIFTTATTMYGQSMTRMCLVMGFLGMGSDPMRSDAMGCRWWSRSWMMSPSGNAHLKFLTWKINIFTASHGASVCLFSFRSTSTPFSYVPPPPWVFFVSARYIFSLQLAFSTRKVFIPFRYVLAASLSLLTLWIKSQTLSNCYNYN